MNMIKVSLLLIALIGQSAQAQTLRLCYEDAENIPWNVLGGTGLNNKLVAIAASEAGVRVEMVAQPWKRCLADVADGVLAGVIGASYSDERAAYAVYPTTSDGKPDPARRIRFDGYSLYRQKGSSASWNGKSFSNLDGPVGAQLGYAVVGDLKKIGVTTEESSGDATTQMRKLVLGRIPLIALLSYEGDALMQEPEFSTSIEKISPPFSQKPYFVIFNKPFYTSNKRAVDDLWAAMAAVRESPAFKKLVSDKLKK